MITDLDKHQVVVLVFTMKDCPGCHEYAPRFMEVSSHFPHVPAYILDSDNPQNQHLADRFRIQATPTTIVARRPVGALRAEGNIANEDIVKMFQVAERAQGA